MLPTAVYCNSCNFTKVFDQFDATSILNAFKLLTEIIIRAIIVIVTAFDLVIIIVHFMLV
jgi:hypothetical protein